eukprot:GHVR01086908.1.p2 GENE.GHVR01086908.1~~GHVR01086908.1.p2  ORF type:complete len:128 (-),score=67.87 GHVR01086908.1:151-480(-)
MSVLCEGIDSVGVGLILLYAKGKINKFYLSHTLIPLVCVCVSTLKMFTSETTEDNKIKKKCDTHTNTHPHTHTHTHTHAHIIRKNSHNVNPYIFIYIFIYMCVNTHTQL